MKHFLAFVILLFASVAPAQTTGPLKGKNFSGGRTPQIGGE